MDGSQTESRKFNSFLKAASIGMVILGLGLFLSRNKSVGPNLKPAFASLNEKESEAVIKNPQMFSATSPNQRHLAANTIQNPSPQRALERIQESKSVRDLLRDPKNALKEVEKVEGSGVSTIKFQHTYNGIEVLGSMALYHIGPAGEQIQNQLSAVQINTKPKLSPAQVETRAKKKVGRFSQITTAPQIKIVPARNSQPPKLIYTAKVKDSNSTLHEVWVDAHSGEVINDMARTRETM